MMRFYLAMLMSTSLAACRSHETFPPIEDRVASPIDITVSDDGERFYVLNADFDRTYNQGSILVLSKEGQKLGATEIPRMGRKMALAGQDLLVATDFNDGRAKPQLIVFDVSDPAKPVEKASLEVSCSPINIALRKNYPHFALSCLDGSLYIGTLTPDRANSTIKRVRSFGTPKRALLLDPQRELLIGFSTDISQKTLSDVELRDATRFDTSAKEVKGPEGQQLPNDVPDLWEETIRAQTNRAQRQPYYYFVYNLARERSKAPNCIPTEEESCDFPFRKSTEQEALRELRWTYFRLAGPDGKPDESPFAGDPTYRYYRTNFWEAKPDLTNPDVFYISQRGVKDRSPLANQILKVTITGDLKAETEAPKTESVLKFERIYGFKNEESKPNHFPGDFYVGPVQGKNTVVVNHFRDLVNWGKGDQIYSLAAKSLDPGSNFLTEIEGTLSSQNVTTYYQVAVTPYGRVATCSFYGNTVILFQLTEGQGFGELARIE